MRQGPPSAAAGCSFEALSALAPYVRVGADTIDSWGGSIYNGFSEYTQAVAPSVRPHHFGDLASLMVGKVHCVIVNGGHTRSPCPPSVARSGLSFAACTLDPQGRHRCLYSVRVSSLVNRVAAAGRDIPCWVI